MTMMTGEYAVASDETNFPMAGKLNKSLHFYSFIVIRRCFGWQRWQPHCLLLLLSSLLFIFVWDAFRALLSGQTLWLDYAMHLRLTLFRFNFVLFRATAIVCLKMSSYGDYFVRSLRKMFIRSLIHQPTREKRPIIHLRKQSISTKSKFKWKIPNQTKQIDCIAEECPLADTPLQISMRTSSGWSNSRMHAAFMANSALNNIGQLREHIQIRKQWPTKKERKI